MGFQVQEQMTQISNIFIDEYMPQAIPAFVVAYLYAFRQVTGGNTSLSNGEIAKALGMLESDVVRAWEYWQSQGIAKVEENGMVTFLSLVGKKEEPPKQNRILISEKRPEYGIEEIATYQQNSKLVKELFDSAQEQLGKLLTYNDMSVLFSFYDWLGLPVEVIEMLLAYATRQGHYNLRYIEKIAIQWAEIGIHTTQEAMDFISERKENYDVIMKALGFTGRRAVGGEEAFIQKWRREYGFSAEIICMACEKTVMQTGKGSFPYADKILQGWKEQKVSTKADVERLEAAFLAEKQGKKQIATPQKQATAPKKQNRFVNFEQRKWDFDAIEKFERERE